MAVGLGISCWLDCFLLVLFSYVVVGADRPRDGLQSTKNESEWNSAEIQLQKILMKMSEISDRLLAQEEQIKILSGRVGDFKCNGQAIPSRKGEITHCHFEILASYCYFTAATCFPSIPVLTFPGDGVTCFKKLIKMDVEPSPCVFYKADLILGARGI